VKKNGDEKMNKVIRTRSFIIFLTLIVITSLWRIDSVKADSIQITTSETYLTAGQENYIIINLRNIGDRSVVGVQAVLTSSTPGISIVDGSQRVYTVIKEGETRRYTSTVYIDKTLPLGSYTLTLTVTYQKITFEYVTSTISVGVIIGESYTPKLSLNIDQENITAISGSKNVVSYELQNIANNNLKEIELVVTSISPYITIIDGDTIFYKTLDAKKPLTINPTISVLEDIPLTTYTLTVTASFSDETGKSFFEVFYLPVNVNSAKISKTTSVTISDITLNPSMVHPGEIFDLEIVLDCSGANAYDLLSTISVSQISPISPLIPSTKDIGDLNTVERVSFYYSLLVSGDTSAGQYPVTIIISYTNNKGVRKTLTETITILVDGFIEFQLLDTPTPKGYPGETEELEADLLLIGTESVQFVSISLVENNVFSRVTGSEEYIGAIDPDSPIPFDILYRIENDTEPSYHTMKLKIQYRDHLNRPHESIIDLELEVGEGKKPENKNVNGGGFWSWLRNLFR
jgi:hypothetical protein